MTHQIIDDIFREVPGDIGSRIVMVYRPHLPVMTESQAALHAYRDHGYVTVQHEDYSELSKYLWNIAWKTKKPGP
jgi:hypothetical protein